MDRFDVVIVGYGPVSQLLALTLGRQGRSVVVIERWTQRYPLPRAVCLDHEIYRVLCANGLGTVLPSISHGGAVYRWFNAEWRELMAIDWSTESISGGPSVHFVHQPTLETSLDRAVLAQAGVRVFTDCEAIHADQDEAIAWVDVTTASDRSTQRLFGRYVVGCDGANSLVRSLIGGGQEDRGFEADWLVVDVKLKDGVTIEQMGIPHSGQLCDPLQPTTIVPAGVQAGQFYRRWEFMRLPGVSVEELESEQRVWELLSRWTGPHEVELVRHKVYNFRSLIADRWRDRRLLIAGDAAHVMPPFLGQGMCSGMRDVWNLAWKLAFVLDGRASDALLDTYQAERRPHVAHLTDLSIYLGKIICIPDEETAHERDRAFIEGTQPAFPALAGLDAGLVLTEPDGNLARGAGALAPHVTVWRGGRLIRLDELTGAAFVLVLRADAPADVPARQQALLDVLGAHTLWLGEGCDVDGKLEPFMNDIGWSAMIVRPDYYIYGGARSIDEIPRLIDRLMDDLANAGMTGADALIDGPFLSSLAT